jgi:dolichol-phosphate mannosyltransferase
MLEQHMRVRPLISIAVPVFNEAGNLSALYGRLCQIGHTMADRCELEFVFTDNHSNDATWEILTDLAQKDQRVRAMRFSKNFGFQRSILANYLHTRGDAVMQLDADLQDPPEMLEIFFKHWQAGHHVVYGLRCIRPEGLLISALRRLGYWMIDKVSEYTIPPNAGDFRLIDRKVLEALIKIKTPSPYLRGTIAGLGFSQIGIMYNRDGHIAGESKFNLVRLISLGLTAVFNHSTVPLRMASLFGGLMVGGSFVLACYYFILRLFRPEIPHGVTSILIFLIFGIGLQSLFMGIIGEYILRLYRMLQEEPIAIVQQSLNFMQDELKL